MRPTTIKLVQIRFPPNEAFLALRGVNIYSSFVDGGQFYICIFEMLIILILYVEICFLLL